MSIKELSQLYCLNREIAQHEARLEELRSKATSTTQTITDMPRAPGVTDKVGKFGAEIVDLCAKLDAVKQSRIVERDALLLYIEAIPDGLTRQIFMLRFYDGLSWEQVAHHVGGNNTGGGVKQRVFRFIKLSPYVATGCAKMLK